MALNIKQSVRKWNRARKGDLHWGKSCRVKRNEFLHLVGIVLLTGCHLGGKSVWLCQQSSFIYISSCGWAFLNGKGKISECVHKVLQMGFPLLGGLSQVEWLGGLMLLCAAHRSFTESNICLCWGEIKELRNNFLFCPPPVSLHVKSY